MSKIMKIDNQELENTRDKLFKIQSLMKMLDMAGATSYTNKEVQDTELEAISHVVTALADEAIDILERHI